MARRRYEDEEEEDDEPRVYRHDECGERTVMPDDLVRAYLADPFRFNDTTYCCGCEEYVPNRECVWVRTGQPLDEYFDELEAEAIRAGRGPRRTPGWILPILFAVGAGFGLCVAGAKVANGPGAVIGGVLGSVGGAVSGLVVWRTRRAPAPQRSRQRDDDEYERPRRRRRRRDEDD
jgi:hypothetical protein